MKMKPQYAIPAVALAASIAISVAPVSIPKPGAAQDVRDRIESLRQILKGQGAIVETEGRAEPLAKFSGTFPNAHNKEPGCTSRTC
jgi:hypothetical protein